MTEPIPTTADPALLDAAAKLTGQMGALGGEFRQFRAVTMSESRRAKRFARVLGMSLIFDIVLSVGLGLVAWRANTAASRATAATSTEGRSHTRALELCNLANANRSVIGKILVLSGTQVPLPAGADPTLVAAWQARQAVSDAVLAKTLPLVAPADCTKVASGS